MSKKSPTLPPPKPLSGDHFGVTDGCPILIAATRISSQYSWASLFAAGRTENVDIGNITLYPCTCNPDDIRVSFSGTALGRMHARIYGSSKKIAAICISLGIGTIENPTPIRQQRDDDQWS